MATELQAVNFPFYELEHDPFKYGFDGWRVAIVLDAGEGKKAATLYLPGRLQTVKVDPKRLATKATPVKLSVAFQRETIARKARIFRQGGTSYDRKATVFVLKALGAGARTVAEVSQPAPIPEPTEWKLTVDTALSIRAEQRMFFRAQGLTFAQDAKPKRMADVKVTFDKTGGRVEQMQFGF
jgi:hypothetical protein